MKNNPNYKFTPLGYIPVDWDVRKLKNITNKIGSGITPKGGESVYSKSGRPFLRSQNIGWGILILEQVAFISEEIHSTFKSSELKLGDVLLNITGASIGRCAIATREVEFGNVNQHVCILRPMQKFVIPKFLNLFILSAKGQNFISVLQTGGNRQGLNYEQVGNFYIPLPPLQEQKNIAQLLLLWDNAIEKTEQLLKLKEDYKKGLMQQLLTGKKRLKGFNGEWKEVKLGKIFTERNETNFPSLTLLSLGAIGIYPQSESIKKDTSNDDKSKYLRIMPGDIGYNTMRLWQGRCAFSEVEGILSPAYTVIIPNKYAYGKYFAYLFKLHSIIGLFFRYSQGLVDDTLNCKFHHFAQIHIEIPTFQEQTAIVEVLEKADKEIEIIKKEIEALKEQKKGLMQILLTGKVRLK